MEALYLWGEEKLKRIAVDGAPVDSHLNATREMLVGKYC
jgi:hypothetical protein